MFVLLVHPSNRNIFVQALLDLTKYEDLGVRREVAHTVARLAADASCREKILQYGIISTLVTMSKVDDVDTTTGRRVPR